MVSKILNEKTKPYQRVSIFNEFCDASSSSSEQHSERSHEQ